MRTWAISAASPFNGLVCLRVAALVLNYFGQGHWCSRPGSNTQSVLFARAGMALYPMVGLSTAATVIASQRDLRRILGNPPGHPDGLCPRLIIRHTSATRIRPDLRPFRELVPDGRRRPADSDLQECGQPGRRYGIAVTGNFAISTILMCVVMRVVGI